MKKTIARALFIVFAATACATMDIPQAFRGRMFERTGPLTLYRSGQGFVGPILQPGSYVTGLYNELMMVDCSTVTQHDPLSVLTKDGVQFGLDMYVRFSANCSDNGVGQILGSLSPDRPNAITTKKLFETYVRPAIGAVVREAISPYRASEINDKHEEILTRIKKRFLEVIDAHEGEVINIYEVTLSNLDFPDAMDAANVDRAVQAILRDKAVAERERVRAEIETAVLRRELAQRDGETAAAKIDAIGAALHRNPDYLQYDMQAKMPDIYAQAGARGNMVITAPQPTIIVPQKTLPPMQAPAQQAPPARPVAPKPQQ
jgi:regulator of protease activity HflC (stomatin/prohibitin superfamily)